MKETRLWKLLQSGVHLSSLRLQDNSYGGENNDFVAFLRPIVILVVAMLFFHLPTVIYKARLLLRGILYFLFCKDKRWNTPPDPGSIFGPHLSQDLPVERKTIYFVRHGESTWNDTFNKGSHRSVAQFLLGFIPGLVKALLYEIYLLLTGQMDSWFYDAPLSQLGLAQVEELRAFLINPRKISPVNQISRKDGSEVDSVSSANASSDIMKNSIPQDEQLQRHLRILRCEPGSPRSKIVSSNLRRAISTVAGGFRDRLYRNGPTKDKIIVIDALQEISSNPDTLSITPAYTQVQASWLEKSAASAAQNLQQQGCNYQAIFDHQTDMSLHSGNKPLHTNGLIRMNEFCEFVFQSPMLKHTNHVIVGGHSLWFRSFFNLFLPFSVNHLSKKKKIVNGGIVTFDLLKAETRRGPRYMVDPKTIEIIYGGFS